MIRPAYELNHPPVLLPASNVPQSTLCELDADNIIIESIKGAEDGQGYILRIYVAEGSATQCQLKINHQLTSIVQTNMLEDVESQYNVAANEIELKFTPFEIKTLKITPTN